MSKSVGGETTSLDPRSQRNNEELCNPVHESDFQVGFYELFNIYELCIYGKLVTFVLLDLVGKRRCLLDQGRRFD